MSTATALTAENTSGAFQDCCLAQAIEQEESLRSLTAKHLSGGRGRELLSIMTTMQMAPIRPDSGDRLAGWLISDSLPRAFAFAAIGLVLAMISPAVCWLEGTLSNETLRLDLLRDFGYWTMVVLGLPLCILSLSLFLGCFPEVVAELCLTDTVSLTVKDWNEFAPWANKVFAEGFGRWFPILVPITANLVVIRVFAFGSQNAWQCPRGRNWGTIAGWVSLLPTFAVWYIIGLGVERVYSTYLVLSRLFSDYPTRVQPLHPDGCGGLSPLGRLCMRLNIAVFVFGLLIAVAVIMGSLTRGTWTLLTPLPILIFIAYVAASAVVFFLPLYAAHARMRRAKHDMLRTVSRQFDALTKELMSELRTTGRVNTGFVEEVERLKRVHDLARSMPVYPFNTKMISWFTGSMAAPVLIAALTHWVETLLR